LFLGVLAAAGFVVGLRGIFHYGYVGQDFVYHRALTLLFPSAPFRDSYLRTNPPGLYWLGSMIRAHVSAGHDLEVTALAFLALNISGLLIIYGLLWKCISRWQLRYSAAALVTFVPFRVIHSVVISADAFTLPIFALTALFTLRLYEEPRRLRSWAGLSLTLLAGMLCKYSFAGLLPPVALLLAVAIGTRIRAGERLRWWATGAVALALPAAAILLQLEESAQLKGTLTNQVWLPSGAPPVMTWGDILKVKRADAGLLMAPEYFRDKVYETGKYSYPGLLHLSSFTDIMGIFQPPPGDISEQVRKLKMVPADRGRTERSQVLQVWAVRWCLGFSALALLGTVFCGVLSIASLATQRPLVANATVVMTALATGFYCPIVLNLPRVTEPYTGGYWLARLALPSLVVFLSLGFVMLDRLFDRLGRFRPATGPLQFAFTGYTLVACALFVGFLV
jgi:hypothetical protein